MTDRGRSGISSASDEELLPRQSALQAEARKVLGWVNLAALVAGVGPLLVTGSFVSGLMGWRELDVMVCVGDDFSPQDVLRLRQRIVARTGQRPWNTTMSGVRDAQPARSVMSVTTCPLRWSGRATAGGSI